MLKWKRVFTKSKDLFFYDFTTDSNTSIVLVAVFSQENLFTQSKPEEIIFFLSFVSSVIWIIKLDNSSILSGSKYTAHSPAISGKDPAFAHKTGIPVAMASITGSPTPSATEGNMHASAQEYNLGKFTWGKCPTKRISELYSECAITLWISFEEEPSLPAKTNLWGNPVFF